MEKHILISNIGWFPSYQKITYSVNNENHTSIFVFDAIYQYLNNKNKNTKIILIFPESLFKPEDLKKHSFKDLHKIARKRIIDELNQEKKQQDITKKDIERIEEILDLSELIILPSSGRYIIDQNNKIEGWFIQKSRNSFETIKTYLFIELYNKLKHLLIYPYPDEETKVYFHLDISHGHNINTLLIIEAFKEFYELLKYYETPYTYTQEQTITYNFNYYISEPFNKSTHTEERIYKIFTIKGENSIIEDTLGKIRIDIPIEIKEIYAINKLENLNLINHALIRYYNNKTLHHKEKIQTLVEEILKKHNEKYIRSRKKANSKNENEVKIEYDHTNNNNYMKDILKHFVYYLKIKSHFDKYIENNLINKHIIFRGSKETINYNNIRKNLEKYTYKDYFLFTTSIYLQKLNVIKKRKVELPKNSNDIFFEDTRIIINYKELRNYLATNREDHYFNIWKNKVKNKELAIDEEVILENLWKHSSKENTTSTATTRNLLSHIGFLRNATYINYNPDNSSKVEDLKGDKYYLRIDTNNKELKEAIEKLIN